MTIPALSTADKSFICSYNIGSNIDHRKALGVINEITTFTNEYIDGFCWIPANTTITDNNDSWYADVPGKDICYVKVGVRCSSDGYLHAWLINTQEVSELILWNNNYNTTNQPPDDTTILHLCIEKMYRVVFGNTTSFVSANIKFQNYISSTERLYLFGNYSNSVTHRVEYSGAANIVKASVSWYPNNSTTVYGDFLYTDSTVWDCWIRWNYAIDADGWCDFSYVTITKAFLDDGGSFTDYTTEFNDNILNNCPLIPVTESVNDAFYFGGDSEFDIITLNMGTAGVGNTIVWEYWNGSAWTSLTVTDTTSGFTDIGVGNVSFTIPIDWVTCTVNGSSQYWVRSRVSVAAFTTQPLLTQGVIRTSSSIWSKAREPIFFKSTPASTGTSISSYCEPGSGESKHVVMCYDYLASNGIGNNSGRSYPMSFTVTTPPGCGGFVCDKISVTNVGYTIDVEPNRAYIWVPGACSGASGGNQTECEANGGTWVPGHYTCDPSFTYDTSVTFNYGALTRVYPTEIDYVNSRAKFNNIPEDTKMFVDYSYPTSGIEIFNEYDGDLDRLDHSSAGLVSSNSIYTIFTKHVAFGILTGADDLTITSDWIITWGIDNYFSNWQTPDGLVLRDPGTTNTPYVIPITHHDEFNIVADEPVLGGFLYEPATSDAFLSRDPGTETKIVIPVSNQTDFDFLTTLLTSDGFLSRNPGTEVKILYSVSDNADFSFLYKFEKLANLYHLKTDGDDTKDGLSWPEAWKHWTFAMANVQDERTLLVEEGVYNDSETVLGATNSIVIFLVKNGVDAVSTVEVII